MSCTVLHVAKLKFHLEHAMANIVPFDLFRKKWYTARLHKVAVVNAEIMDKHFLFTVLLQHE